jgi:hypothetical protein
MISRKKLKLDGGYTVPVHDVFNLLHTRVETKIFVIVFLRNVRAPFLTFCEKSTRNGTQKSKRQKSDPGNVHKKMRQTVRNDGRCLALPNSPHI